MPPMSEPQKDKLRPQMEAFNPPDNPLDMGTITAWKPDLVRTGAETLMEDPRLGSLIVSIPGNNSPTGATWVERLRWRGPAARPKPWVLVLQNETAPLSPQVADTVKKNRIVLLRSPERGFRAVARLTAYAEQDPGLPLCAVPKAPAFTGLPALGKGMQPEWLGKQVLQAIGLPVPAGGLARSLAEARETAARVGYPVCAVKAQAAGLAHKTEAGGVLLSIADAAALGQAWETLYANVARARGRGPWRLRGRAGRGNGGAGFGLAVGARRDPGWGPIVMVGLGGIWIEVLGDVRLLPPRSAGRRDRRGASPPEGGQAVRRLPRRGPRRRGHGGRARGRAGGAADADRSRNPGDRHQSGSSATATARGVTALERADHLPRLRERRDSLVADAQ